MFIKKICRTLLKVFAIAFFAQAAYAEVTLKLGTTGRLGMPIGDAIDQALIPAMEKASGGKMKIEPEVKQKRNFYNQNGIAIKSCINNVVVNLFILV